MREQKSNKSENKEITELGYLGPEDSELLVDPVSLRVTAATHNTKRLATQLSQFWDQIGVFVSFFGEEP